jgi:hypothetical protein
MESSIPNISKKTEFLPLYDGDGNPTEILLGLRSIYECSGRDVYNLFQYIDFEIIPNGLSSRHVWQMAHGKGRKKKISKEQYDFLKNQFFPIDLLKPSEVKIEDVETKDIEIYKHVTVPISPQFKIRILKNIRLSEKPINEFFLDDKSVPEGLTAAKLIGILQSQINTIPKSYYDFANRNWYKISPSANPYKLDILVPVTVSYKARILRNIAWSEKPFEEYFQDKKIVPNGLSQEKLIKWLESDSLEFKNSYVEFAKHNWWNITAKKREPKPPKPEVIILNNQIIDKMMNEFHRTGVGIVKALKYVDDLPQGLSPTIVGRWFEKKNRYYPTAKKEHIDFVLSLYRGFPDKVKSNR